MHLLPVSSYLRFECSSNTWSDYSCIPGIVILIHSFFLFISSGHELAGLIERALN